MKGIILALQFLTRIPLPIQVDFTHENAKHALFAFPFISGLMGLIFGWVHQWLFPHSAMVAAFVGLLLWNLLNGGLHLDGLGDTFDGFLSNRSREEKLRIMHDSTVGTFAILAIFLVLLGKFALLSAHNYGPVKLMAALFSARLGVLYCIGFAPSARPDGLGAYFQSGRPQKGIVLLTALTALALWFWYPRALFLLLGGCFNGLWISWWSIRNIGGVSGDIFGAAMELGELVCLLILWGITL
ncbi:MAG: adenosylcobinamide-GDP ribazoletransferase [Tissierellia bacterium]|nr:adenosylcobinamide-GDP ribazoletransferase [Tissierellia bacterium]